MGDAYADLGKNTEALDYYKKAAHHFEEDEAASAEALFMAAYLADSVIKRSERSYRTVQRIKRKISKNTAQGYDADKYLAQIRCL